MKYKQLLKITEEISMRQSARTKPCTQEQPSIANLKFCNKLPKKHTSRDKLQFLTGSDRQRDLRMITDKNTLEKRKLL